MPTKKEQEEAGRLANKAGVGQMFEGESIPMEELKGKELTVLDFKFIPSTYREGEDFLSIQAEMDGEKIVVNTNAQAILGYFRDQIKKEMLPAPVRFIKVKAATSGREYWNME